MKPEGLISENGLLKQLTKSLREKAMQPEMTKHLGYPKKSTRDIQSHLEDMYEVEVSPTLVSQMR